MSKRIKQLLVSASAILMIAGVGTSASNININAKRHHARTHRVYRHHSRKRIPNLATYNNYGHYKIKITKPTKLTYEKLDFATSNKILKSKKLHKGTILKIAGNMSQYDGPVYVAYGRHSFGNNLKNNKRSLITLTHHNYKFIRKI